MSSWGVSCVGSSSRQFRECPSLKWGVTMAVDQPFPYGWRGGAALLAAKLDRAHSAVQVLGKELEAGDIRSARRSHDLAREAVVSVTKQVKAMRAEQPATEDLDEPVATGSALAVRGCGAATVALGVMVDAMGALVMTDDEGDTHVLIGACLDAEQAYDDSTAIVTAASQTHGSAMLDLKRAFDAEGEVALRRRVIAARTQVRDINERVGVATQRHASHMPAPRGRLEVGTSVAVRNRFVGSWRGGFEVVEQVGDGYRIKRVSDGAILPDVIGGDEVRSDRHNHNVLW